MPHAARRLHLMALIAALPFVGMPGSARGGTTLYVDNKGTDGPATCGTKAAPCRSISQAIANAQLDDTILVGAGRYGDLNDDGSFDDPGDEAAEVDTGCDCMLKIDKRVSLFSLSGAGVTVLDAAGASIAVVHVAAASVTVGAPGRGFLLVGSGDSAGLRSAANAAVVVGNRAIDNGEQGFDLDGNLHLVAGNRAIGNSGVGFELGGIGNTVLENAALYNEVGFETFDGPNLVQSNLASGNEIGVRAGGSGATFVANVASGNSGIGWVLRVASAGFMLRGNLVQGNGSQGLLISGSSHVLTGNSIVGNRLSGVLVLSGASAISVEQGNLFGNNDALDLGMRNCGVFNLSMGNVLALENFWGTPSGPGGDPGDTVCNGVFSSIEFGPVAAKEFKVKAEAAR